MQLIGDGRQDMRLNNAGNQKEAGECIDQENDECSDRERERTEEPTHGPSHVDIEQLGFYLFIFMQRNARLTGEGFLLLYGQLNEVHFSDRWRAAAF